MPNGTVSEVEKLSGVAEQLTPEDQQIVGGEPQTLTQAPMPLVEVTEPDKRIAPLPVTIAPSAEGAPAAFPAGGAVPVYYPGQPVVIINRYNGADTDFQPLVRWDIPDGLLGELHEISLLSTDDAHTRYRIVLANIDQSLPTDRATSTPLRWPWRNSTIPGGTSVYIEVRSTNGTVIQVDGEITGTYKSVP